VEDLTLQLWAVLLVSLRIAPTLAFAPPFTLLRIPVPVRVILALALSMALVAGHPDAALSALRAGQWPVSLAAGELFIGIAVALSLQCAFAAILWAGRAVDIQAGFGLAMVADPTTAAQMPLAGTIFAYAAALIFFAMGGAYDLLALWAASLKSLPLGAARIAGDMAALASFLSACFAAGLGLFGVTFLVLFLLDVAIAFMSRTLPQMNMLLIGFQVKSIAMLATLPISLALSTGIALHMLRSAMESAPRLLGAAG